MVIILVQTFFYFTSNLIRIFIIIMFDCFLASNRASMLSSDLQGCTGTHDIQSSLNLKAYLRTGSFQHIWRVYLLLYMALSI